VPKQTEPRAAFQSRDSREAGPRDDPETHGGKPRGFAFKLKLDCMIPVLGGLAAGAEAPKVKSFQGDVGAAGGGLPASTFRTKESICTEPLTRVAVSTLLVFREPGLASQAHHYTVAQE
jgi:hypothetical protein